MTGFSFWFELKPLTLPLSSPYVPVLSKAISDFNSCHLLKVTPKQEPLSLMVGRMESMRASVMVCPWWWFPCLVTRVTTCTAWQLEGWEWSSASMTSLHKHCSMLSTQLLMTAGEGLTVFNILFSNIFFLNASLVLSPVAISKEWRSCRPYTMTVPCSPWILQSTGQSLLWDTRGQTIWDLLPMTSTGFSTTVWMWLASCFLLYW